MKKCMCKKLQSVIDDYIKHTERLNERKLEYANKELKTCVEEMKVFSLLKNNIKLLQEADGIPQDL